MDPETLADPEMIKKTKQKRYINLLFILIGLLFLASLAYFAGYRVTIPALSPTPLSQAPEQAVNKDAEYNNQLENCSSQKGVTPLINEVSVKDNIQTGTLIGHINDITFEASKSAKVNLVSIKADQLYPFDLPNLKNVIYDDKQLKYVSISELKTGQSVSIQFDCDPKRPNNQKFRITQIRILK